jgi:biotin carboxyl carrier protein
MKIDKKLIKELVDNLDEFKLTELEYQVGDIKIKVSKATKGSNISKVSETVISNNKAVLNDEEDGVRVKSPIIGTAYLAA